MTELSAFMHLYLFEIEELINNKPSLLFGVNYQYEEANSDKELKECFKKIINNHNRISSDQDLVVAFANPAGDPLKFDKQCVSKFSINKVYLPKELTKELKQKIKDGKSGVYTNPDLYLEVIDEKSGEISHISIELKSTKQDKIPGSSIQQVTPEEWVIFVKHTKDDLAIATGQYRNALTGQLPFPDRSPRPEISYSAISQWNVGNRILDRENSVLTFDYTQGATVENEKFLTSWHEHLVEQWLDVSTQNANADSEKWFNHTIKLYSLALLEHYAELRSEDQEKLLESLRQTTKK